MDARQFRQLTASRMSEDDLLSQVRGMARQLGWLVYHTYRSTRSEPGFPDLVLVRNNRLMVRELKTRRGRTSKHQKEWIERLRLANVDVGIWRPADLVDGRIARELRYPGVEEDQLVERIAVAICPFNTEREPEPPAQVHQPFDRQHEPCRARARRALDTVRVATTGGDRW